MTMPKIVYDVNEKLFYVFVDGSVYYRAPTVAECMEFIQALGSYVAECLS